MKRCWALVCTCQILVATSLADDWPQWQGPNRNAISNEKGLLKEWPEGGPALAWRVEGVGGGDSAPAVSAGKLIGMSNRDGQEIVWARSETDGKELWSASLGDAVAQRMPQSKEGPGGTPTVDGDHVYVIGMGGRVVCLQLTDGKIVWERSLTEDFGGAVPAWSFRESPLIDGDKLICTPGGADATLVALNKLTGETVWKAVLPASESSQAEAQSRPARGEEQNDRRGGSDRQDRNARGGTTQRGPAIAGTKDPDLFVSEHWGMTEFAQKVANGKYVVNLYFAETYQGITGEGQRVFTLGVHGQEIKDFDMWKKAGGPRKAYIESVPVEVTDGELKVTFKQQVENPAIKAIEIIPQFGDVAKNTVRINAGANAVVKDSNGNEWQADKGFKDGSVNAGTNTFAFGNFGGGGRGGNGGRRGGGGRGRGFGGPRAGAAYSSVIAIDFEGQRQFVQLTANTLVGVSADGKFLWKYDRPANRMGINCSTPIYQDGLVFAASAYGNGGGAVKISKTAAGEFQADEVYFTSNMQNHHGGMIVHDGCLYGANGGNGGGFLSCLDFQTGKVLWRDRGAEKGALAFADERLYLRTEDGEVILIEPDKKKLVERGRFDQPDRTSVPAWAHPVIANGKLYIRDQDLLLCYDVSAN